MSIANNLFDFSPFGRRPLVQVLKESNRQMLKQVQHDIMVKDGGALTHVPHGHPELVSGSVDSNRQMLNQVQHDKMMKDRGMVSMTKG